MIMEATTPRRLNTASRLGVMALAAVLLPVLPTQAQEKQKRRKNPELREALERIEELEEHVKKIAAQQSESVVSVLENPRADRAAAPPADLRRRRAGAEGQPALAPGGPG